MRDPKRILKKLIGTDIQIGPFDTSGESLEQAVATFRDVAKCRKFRDFIKASFGRQKALFDSLDNSNVVSTHVNSHWDWLVI